MTKINVTLDQLRWCRIEDVLRWIDPYIWGEKVIECVFMMARGKEANVTIPATHFTASVIARGVENLTLLNCEFDEYKFVTYNAVDERGMICIEDKNHCTLKTVNMPINPDPYTNRTEWTRQEIEAILKEMES